MHLRDLSSEIPTPIFVLASWVAWTVGWGLGAEKTKTSTNYRCLFENIEGRGRGV